jgi:hypothetical protein
MVLACGLPAGLSWADATSLGPVHTIASGSDPDVAVDDLGRLHVVYVRSNTTYYRLVALPDLGPEITVGAGTDPQVDVDGANRCHVVLGALSYARCSGSTVGPAVSVGAYWRKPRLAVDSRDNVYMTAERYEPRAVVLHAYRDGQSVVGPVVVGDDNNGGIAVDTQDVVHVTWRAFSVYHNTFRLGVGPGTSFLLHPASDFSWCAVNVLDNSVHVVNTIRNGGGVHYRKRVGGTWSDVVTLAEQEVLGVDDADNVGPTIGTDSLGAKYVAFSGAGRIPYYFVISPTGTVSPVMRLDPETGTLAGGKFQNPNVGTHPARPGAYVAWGNGTVYVRSVGVATALPDAGAGPADAAPGGRDGALVAADAARRDVGSPSGQDAASPPPRDAGAAPDGHAGTTGYPDAARAADGPPVAHGPAEVGCGCGATDDESTGRAALWVAAVACLVARRRSARSRRSGCPSR